MQSSDYFDKSSNVETVILSMGHSVEGTGPVVRIVLSIGFPHQLTAPCVQDTIGKRITEDDIKMFQDILCKALTIEYRGWT